MAKSELISMENNGIIRKLTILNRLDLGAGLIDLSIKATGSIRSLTSYTKGAYNDEFGKDVAGRLLSGDGVSVYSATRNSRNAILGVHISTQFREMDFSVMFPHKDY